MVGRPSPDCRIIVIFPVNKGDPRADALRLATILLQVNCRARAKRPPVSVLALLRGRDSETGTVAGTHVAPSERWRSGWDHEFESPLLQRGVSSKRDWTPGMEAYLALH